jgi:hypothetical protein
MATFEELLDQEELVEVDLQVGDLKTSIFVDRDTFDDFRNSKDAEGLENHLKDVYQEQQDTKGASKISKAFNPDSDTDVEVVSARPVTNREFRDRINDVGRRTKFTESLQERSERSGRSLARGTQSRGTEGPSDLDVELTSEQAGDAVRREAGEIPDAERDVRSEEVRRINEQEKADAAERAANEPDPEQKAARERNKKYRRDAKSKNPATRLVSKASLFLSPGLATGRVPTKAEVRAEALKKQQDEAKAKEAELLRRQADKKDPAKKGASKAGKASKAAKAAKAAAPMGMGGTLLRMLGPIGYGLMAYDLATRGSRRAKEDANKNREMMLALQAGIQQKALSRDSTGHFGAVADMARPSNLNAGANRDRLSSELQQLIQGREQELQRIASNNRPGYAELMARQGIY